MRIRADEHVSPSIVRIVTELALSPGFEITSVIGAGHRGTEDQYWVTAFATDGGDAIITADTDFFKRPNQIVAVDETGLKVIYLSSKWASAPGYLQAAHILMWWPRIEQRLLAAKQREVWAVKWNINEAGELERRKIDFGAARKKLRKAQRHTPK